jgi:general secretion pathway protein K
MKPVAQGSRQRGVAMIIALILVALATILATKIGFDGLLERRRTAGVLAAEQAMQFSLGAEAIAADALVRSAQGKTNQTTLADPWAQQVPGIPITPENDPEGEPIGLMQGGLEDLQGRFNLNNLAVFVANGTQDPEALAQFQRLLVSLKLEPSWAQKVRDWIDADDQPGEPDGAEDSVYTSQTPPYRTGNWPMMSPSELMNMPGFGADRYRKIAPYVTALPTATAKINICTASAQVLQSFAENLGSDYTPELLASERKSGCFPDKQTFANVLGPTVAAAMASQYSDTSTYFRLTTRVTLGTTEFTLYSLLWRTAGGKVTPLLRTFGTL